MGVCCVPHHNRLRCVSYMCAPIILGCLPCHESHTACAIGSVKQSVSLTPTIVTLSCWQ
jgi:hypothetical protein